MTADRIVFSTRSGRMCAVCGWPQNDCRCSKTSSSGGEAIPERVTAKLRLENRASGKHVTVVDGLPDNHEFLETLVADLKKACGTGGSAGENRIVLQGDQRERLRDLLAKKGFLVKG